YSLPPAPNTEKVRSKLRISAGSIISSDPIEDASDFDNSKDNTQCCSSVGQSMTVKERIELYNRKGKGTESSTQNHPNRIAGMKGRNGKVRNTCDRFFSSHNIPLSEDSNFSWSRKGKPCLRLGQTT
ncbi:MAG TPA: hypothetical protein VGO47_04800, partial [Chlamydiales bacterium]|nr:hypothetical protein [Chlamydiales bacterium]